MIELYRKGYKLREIAEIEGKSIGQVKYYLYDLLGLNERKAGRPFSKPISEEQKQIVFQMIANGYTPKQAAKEIGFRTWRVERMIKET